MARIAQVGCGNIGSNLTLHLGQMEGVDSVLFIDHDSYERGNLESQSIRPSDVGRKKAAVQTRRLRAIRPDLEIEAIGLPFENLPPGRLRGAIILACLDSRRARQQVNRVAMRLGIPWIDSGIAGDGLLARVTCYLPTSGRHCLECAWSARDYDLLEAIYACQGGQAAGAPTRAASSLGALAAAMQALECRKLLAGRLEPGAFEREVLFDAAHHRLYVTSFAVNPDCRLYPHERWGIEPLARGPQEITVAEALELGGGSRGDGERVLRIDGSPFVTRLCCAGCGRARALLRHLASLTPVERRCRGCGAVMTPSGFDQHEALRAGRLAPPVMRRTLGEIGLRAGEVFAVGTNGRERRYELAG